MLCVCLSFPITELCLLKRRSDAFLISAFLTDEEQALTGGTVCFKHRLTCHSVFTSDTTQRCSRSCSCTVLPPQLSWFVFIPVLCYQMYSFPALGSVMAQCKEKWDYISCFFKEVFKATKIHRRERSLWGGGGGGCTLILSSADAIPTMVASSTHLETHPVSKAYHHYGY